MDYILKADKLTNGIITKLIEKTFIAESNGEKYNVSQKELIEIHKIIEKYNNGEVFGEIAKYINYPPRISEETKEKLNEKDTFKGTFERLSFETEELKKMEVELYSEPGFILYDGLCAKAGGRFRYLYRGQGNRIVWFKDGEIKILALWLEINSDGVNFQNHDDLFGSYNIFNKKLNAEDFSEISNYAGDEEFPTIEFKYSDYSDTYFWIEKLTKINMQFSHSYALEYLIIPADVQRLSEFSLKLKSELWEACLNLAKRIITDKLYERYFELFKFYVRFLGMINVEPDTKQLSEFFEDILINTDISTVELRNIIDVLKNNKFNDHPLDVTTLQENLDNIKSGKSDAYRYQEYIFKALNYIFYPHLKNGNYEQDVNDGNMRVDIVFDNNSKEGFFYNLSLHHQIKCPFIMIECKNYANDISNPEFDQLSGRLTDKRGLFGIILCRTVNDREKLIKKCKDIVNERKHYIIVLCDNDIKKLIELKKIDKQDEIDQYLNYILKQILF